MFERIYHRNYKDELFGVPLEDCEILYVKWPNGNISQESIFLDSRFIEYDFICEEMLTSIESYILTTYNGVKSRVYLCQDGIQCKRIGK